MAEKSFSKAQARDQMPPWLPVPEAALLAAWSSPPSAWERRTDRSPIEQLLTVIEAHAAAEADSLAAYRRLAEGSADPVVTLLMRLVLEDEERHHGLLERMAATLDDDVYWQHSPNALPVVTTPAREEPAEIVEATRARLREEHEGVRHLRDLARENARLYDGLFTLLLETIALDSEKHERILRFLLRRLEARG